MPASFVPDWLYTRILESGLLSGNWNPLFYYIVAFVIVILSIYFIFRILSLFKTERNIEKELNNVAESLNLREGFFLFDGFRRDEVLASDKAFFKHAIGGIHRDYFVRAGEVEIPGEGIFNLRETYVYLILQPAKEYEEHEMIKKGLYRLQDSSREGKIVSGKLGDYRMRKGNVMKNGVIRIKNQRVPVAIYPEAVISRLEVCDAKEDFIIKALDKMVSVYRKQTKVFRDYGLME